MREADVGQRPVAHVGCIARVAPFVEMDILLFRFDRIGMVLVRNEPVSVLLA